MHLQTVIILIICAALQMPEMCALKRIKRQFNSVNHDKRIKQDFIMLPTNEKQALSEASKENLKTSTFYETAAADNSKNLTKDSNAKSNTGRSLIEILRKSGKELTGSSKEDITGGAKETTADIKSRALNISEGKSSILPEKRCNKNGIVGEHFSHHKSKYLPHSTGIFEAKIVIPSQHIQPAALHGVGSIGSANLNNLILYKVGIDSSPSNFFYPKMLLTQNLPDLFDEETLNEPSVDYFFHSLGAARKAHGLYRHTFKQSHSPIVDNSWQTHGIFNESPAAVKEPTQMASLMQNALDTLLANSIEDIEGDKSERQIEFSCPMHQDKAGAQIDGDKAADVIQVCSCRLIKKPKEDGAKKKLE